MRYLLIINLLLLYTLSCKAEKYYFESSSSVKYEHLKITKDFKSSTINIENRWTDSLGEYGIGKCNGHILTENKKISLTVFCEQISASGDKFWTQLIRDKDMKAGIGKIRYLNGTGKYEKFIGIECQYAVNYMNNNTNFLKQVCELPGTLKND
tara:strand:- start:174 stop:632 length:459 start_codon:yes stop_codon:yes gene_type:complete